MEQLKKIQWKVFQNFHKNGEKFLKFPRKEFGNNFCGNFFQNCHKKRKKCLKFPKIMIKNFRWEIFQNFRERKKFKKFSKKKMRKKEF